MATAIAYGIDNIENEDDTKTLVIHLGGRTLDVTYLCMDEEGKLVVKSKNSDKNLGGTDFENELTEYYCELYEDFDPD